MSKRSSRTETLSVSATLNWNKRNLKVDIENVRSSFPFIVFSSTVTSSTTACGSLTVVLLRLNKGFHCAGPPEVIINGFRISIQNRYKMQVVISRVREKEAPDLVGQESGKWSHPFPDKDVSQHSLRPPVCTYATVTAVLEVMSCAVYDVVEPWEYRELTPHLGGDHIPEFPPPVAIRGSTRVQDGWRLIIAIRKKIKPIVFVANLHQ